MKLQVGQYISGNRVRVGGLEDDIKNQQNYL